MGKVNWLGKELDAASIARSNGIHNCPNCGAPIDSEKCPYCGTLFVDFAAIDADKPFFIKIKRNGEVFIAKVILSALTVHNEYERLFADNRETLSIPTTDITINFTVIL